MEPAFPIETTSTPYAPGMTLRDWFAGQALVGLTFALTRSEIADLFNGVKAGKIESVAAYRLADAMLAAREQPHDR